MAAGEQYTTKHTLKPKREQIAHTLTHINTRAHLIRGQELGAGADALVFQGTCVDGKLLGKDVVVKMQPRHHTTKFQVELSQMFRNPCIVLVCMSVVVVTAVSWLGVVGGG